MADDLINEKIIENYSENGIFKNERTRDYAMAGIDVVLGLIPFAGQFTSEIIKSELEANRVAKQKALIEAINNFHGRIDTSKLNKIEFLISYAKAQEALFRLANEKKVDYICNLFCNCILQGNDFSGVDLYEEFLGHLTSLSYVELDILITLKKFEEESTINDGKSKLEMYSESYHRLEEYVENSGTFTRDELSGEMQSISRSGFCKEVTGTYLGYEGGILYTTKFFEKFLRYIS